MGESDWVCTRRKGVWRVSFLIDNFVGGLAMTFVRILYVEYYKEVSVVRGL